MDLVVAEALPIKHHKAWAEQESLAKVTTVAMVLLPAGALVVAAAPAQRGNQFRATPGELEVTVYNLLFQEQTPTMEGAAAELLTLETEEEPVA